MTNAEKYLKEGVDLEQLDKELIDYICNQGTDNPYYTYVSDFFKEQVKPTLTDDERVILRNIPMNFMLYRNSVGGLELRDKDKITHYEFYMYDRLFQFIKNGEEYNIKELLEEK